MRSSPALPHSRGPRLPSVRIGFPTATISRHLRTSPASEAAPSTDSITSCGTQPCIRHPPRFFPRLFFTSVSRIVSCSSSMNLMVISSNRGSASSAPCLSCVFRPCHASPSSFSTGRGSIFNPACALTESLVLGVPVTSPVNVQRDITLTLIALSSGTRTGYFTPESSSSPSN